MISIQPSIKHCNHQNSKKIQSSVVMQPVFIKLVWDLLFRINGKVYETGFESAGLGRKLKCQGHGKHGGQHKHIDT